MPVMGSGAHNRTALRGGGTLLLAVFLLSGASGLVYQVVWSRSLTLVFGSTTQGVATVLATFMGGLALGSWIASRRGDRAASPLKIYGLLEGGIALLSLAVLLLMPALETVYKLLYGWVELSLAGLTLLRLFLAALFLLPATTLMGATLPILSAYFERRGSVAGQGASILYAFNTVGAVVGTAAAGFLLLPGLGVAGATLTAAAGNLLAALGSLWLSRQIEEDRREIRIPFAAEGPPSPDGAPSAGEPLPVSTRAAVAASIAVSGAGALILEVCWTRTLSLVLGSSTQAFTIMLTTFLVGLAAGSTLAGRLLGRIPDPVAVFAFAEVGVGLTVYAGIFLFPELPYTFLALYRAAAGSPHLFDLGRFALAGSIMLIPTLLLGTTFPLAVRCARIGTGDAARPVGLLYSVNTLGAIAGSLAAGFLLVPTIGLRPTLLAGALVNLSLGAFLLAVSGRERRTARWAVAAVIFLLMPGLPLSSPAWNPLLMTSGVFQYAPRFSELFKSRQEFLEYHKLNSQLFYRDGLTTTVTVEKRPPRPDGKLWLVLTVNGKVDASSLGDMETQLLLGHVPMLMAPDPGKVLVIGWGSGITVGAALRHPEVRSLKAVEIEEAVVEASRLFHQFNGRPEEDPRVTLEINDARHALLVDQERYDVIISEPSNPWISGPARLFTREFFRIARARLKEDGILCQWVQMYGLDKDAYLTLLRTLADEFEDVVVMKGSPGDTMILASPRPIPMDVARMERRLRQPAVAASMKEIGVEGLPGILVHYRGGGDHIRSLVGEGLVNTDDNAYIEFAAARTLYQVKDLEIDSLLLGLEDSPLDRADPSGLPPEEAARLPVRLARAWMKAGLADRAVSALERAGSTPSLPDGVAAEQATVLGEILSREGEDEAATGAWERALARDPQALGALIQLGRSLRQEGDDPARALELLRRAVAAHPESSEARLELGRCLAVMDRHGEAQDVLAEAERLGPPNDLAPFVEMEWGRSCYATGDYDCAVRKIRRYFHEWREVPKPAEISVDAALDLGRTYLARGERALALEQFRVAAELGGSLARWHAGEAEEALKRGRPDLAEHHWRRAIRWNAHDTDSYVALGRLLSARERWGEALEIWLALLDRRPDEGEGLQGAAACLERLGRSREAIPFMERLLQVEVDAARLPALRKSLERLRSRVASDPSEAGS